MKTVESSKESIRKHVRQRYGKIAQELGVKTVLEGTVRRAAEQRSLFQPRAANRPSLAAVMTPPQDQAEQHPKGSPGSWGIQAMNSPVSRREQTWVSGAATRWPSPPSRKRG